MEIYVCAFVRVCARLHIHYLDKCLKAIRYAICYHMYVYMYATQYVHMHTQVHGVNMCIYNICCIKNKHLLYCCSTSTHCFVPAVMGVKEYKRRMAAFRAKENAVDRPFDSSRMSFSHSHSWTDFIARAEGFKRASQLFFNDADMQQLHSSDGFWLWHVDYASSSFGMIPQTPPPPPPEWPAHSVKAPAKAKASAKPKANAQAKAAQHHHGRYSMKVNHAIEQLAPPPGHIAKDNDSCFEYDIAAPPGLTTIDEEKPLPEHGEPTAPPGTTAPQSIASHQSLTAPPGMHLQCFVNHPCHMQYQQILPPAELNSHLHLLRSYSQHCQFLARQGIQLAPPASRESGLQTAHQQILQHPQQQSFGAKMAPASSSLSAHGTVRTSSSPSSSATAAATATLDEKKAVGRKSPKKISNKKMRGVSEGWKDGVLDDDPKKSPPRGP